MSAGPESAATGAGGRPDGYGAFLPALLLALAVTGWSAFQTGQLVRERGNLRTAIEKQETRVEQSKKLRSRVESLAAGLALLTREGNANATVMVEELRRRGFNIDSAAPPEKSPDSPSGQ